MVVRGPSIHVVHGLKEAELAVRTNSSMLLEFGFLRCNTMKDKREKLEDENKYEDIAKLRR